MCDGDRVSAGLYNCVQRVVIERLPPRIRASVDEADRVHAGSTEANPKKASPRCSRDGAFRWTVRFWIGRCGCEAKLPGLPQSRRWGPARDVLVIDKVDAGALDHLSALLLSAASLGPEPAQDSIRRTTGAVRLLQRTQESFPVRRRLVCTAETGVRRRRRVVRDL